MRFKYTLLLMIFLISITNSINAQYSNDNKEKQSFKERMFFGGGLGLTFGDITAVDVSATIGNRLTEKVHAGVSLSYSYYSYNNYNVSMSNYSGSVFARLFFTDAIFAQTEAEALNTKVFTSYELNDGYRKWIGNYLVGLGYFQKISERSGMMLTVLWNLNETEYTPYNNPIIRVGFVF